MRKPWLRKRIISFHPVRVATGGCLSQVRRRPMLLYPIQPSRQSVSRPWLVAAAWRAGNKEDWRRSLRLIFRFAPQRFHCQRQLYTPRRNQAPRAVRRPYPDDFWLSEHLLDEMMLAFINLNSFHTPRRTSEAQPTSLTLLKDKPLYFLRG